MKAKDVLKILQITRPTLTKYVKNSIINVTTNVNGFYTYNDDDVFKLAKITQQRKCVIYARVSTPKQKHENVFQQKKKENNTGRGRPEK